MNVSFVLDPEYEKGFLKDEIARQRVDDQHAIASRFLTLTKEMYQKSWDEIGNDFSEYIATTTGYPWFYDTYECVVSVVHRGISNWGQAPKIVRGWKESPYSMRRITAHELILSHYFEIHRRKYPRSGLTDGQIWALAEIAGFALTSLTPAVKLFWPWDTEYYTNHNYPHIVQLQNDLKEPFLKMKTFDDYIEIGISLVQKYPLISPNP